MDVSEVHAISTREERTMQRIAFILIITVSCGLQLAFAGVFAARRVYKYNRPLKREAIGVLVGTGLMILLVGISAFLLLIAPSS
jgi:hypothetical protein